MRSADMARSRTPDKGGRLGQSWQLAVPSVPAANANVLAWRRACNSVAAGLGRIVHRHLLLQGSESPFHIRALSHLDADLQNRPGRPEGNGVRDGTSTFLSLMESRIGIAFCAEPGASPVPHSRRRTNEIRNGDTDGFRPVHSPCQRFLCGQALRRKPLTENTSVLDDGTE